LATPQQNPLNKRLADEARIIAGFR